MKVILMQPFFSRDVLSIGIKDFARIRGKYPPLGLAYIASVLLNEGNEVTIIDAELEELTFEEIKRRVTSANPDVIGIGCTDQTFLETKRTAEYVKIEFPDVPLILGGPVVIVYSHIILHASPCFDYAVIGEGESTVGPLLSALGNPVKLSKIPGIIYRENGNIKINQPLPYIENLDSIPFPAWHLLDVHKYSDILSKNKRYCVMITSRGCPFKCSFCDPLGRMGRKFRFRGPKNIFDEMALLKRDFDIQEITFYDDTFTLNKKRIVELCKIIVKEKMKIEWECRTRVDCVDDDLLRIMSEAGCIRIRFGIESANKKSLQFINKGIKLEQAKEAVRLSRKYSIETVAYYMLGIPGETEADVLNTIRFAKGLNTTYANFSVASFTNPNSEMFKWGAKNGLISSTYWEDLILGKEIGECYVSTKELPSKKVFEYVKKAHRAFYLRPRKILQLIIHVFKSSIPVSNFIRLFFNMLEGKRLRWTRRATRENQYKKCKMDYLRALICLLIF
jgi:anaerobic magnesium-protoporphyrin IX monomethyl ester cyclase